MDLLDRFLYEPESFKMDRKEALRIFNNEILKMCNEQQTIALANLICDMINQKGSWQPIMCITGFKLVDLEQGW